MRYVLQNTYTQYVLQSKNLPFELCMYSTSFGAFIHLAARHCCYHRHRRLLIEWNVSNILRLALSLRLFANAPKSNVWQWCPTEVKIYREREGAKVSGKEKNTIKLYGFICCMPWAKRPMCCALVFFRAATLSVALLFHSIVYFCILNSRSGSISGIFDRTSSVAMVVRSGAKNLEQPS